MASTNSEAVCMESTAAAGSSTSAAASGSGSGNNDGNGSTTPITASTVLEAIKAHKEWAKAIAFEHDGRVIASTVIPLDGEIAAFLKLFDKREDTIASGIVLQNEQYDVHRYHPPLIYGRRGDPAVDEGEGIAICKVEKKATKQPVYCLITYVFPTLSARVVPQLKEFCESILANMTA